MSASSRTPPRAARTYLRPRARAIDLAIDVLPTPGGPTNRRIGPLGHGAGLGLGLVGDGASRSCRWRASGLAVSLRLRGARAGTRRSCLDLLGELPGAELADGQELEHAVLDVLQAVVVLVEHLRARGSGRGGRRSGCSRAARRSIRDRCGSPGLPSTRGRRARGGQLALDLDAGLAGQFELVQLLAQLVDLAALVVLAELSSGWP